MLSFETNFFRQELHKWSPVAPVAPPVIEVSKSTRKPRPTKLDKLLSAHGVDDPDKLPDHAKAKGLSLKRKRQNAEMAAAAAAAAASLSGGGHNMSTSPSIHGYPSYFPRATSSQPQTPGLSVASSSHAHPSRGPDSSSSSSHHGHSHGRAGSSGPMPKAEAMDMEANPNIHPSFFMQNGGGPQLIADSSAGPSLDGRLLRGQHGEFTGPGSSAFGQDDFNRLSDDDKEKAIDVLSTTERGRKQAEMFVGHKLFWEQNIGNANEAGYDSGDQEMFNEMINQDDEGAPADGNNSVTAANFENERNGMDALLDGE